MKHKFFLIAGKDQHPLRVLSVVQEWVREIARFDLSDDSEINYMKTMTKFQEIADSITTEEDEKYIVYMKEVNVK